MSKKGLITSAWPFSLFGHKKKDPIDSPLDKLFLKDIKWDVEEYYNLFELSYKEVIVLCYKGKHSRLEVYFKSDRRRDQLRPNIDYTVKVLQVCCGRNIERFKHEEKLSVEAKKREKVAEALKSISEYDLS